MKMFLAVLLVVLGPSALADDAYVVFKRSITVMTPDKIELRLNAGDCARFVSRNDTGAWIKFNAAGLVDTIPWNAVSVVDASNEALSNYKHVSERMARDYQAATADREVKRRADLMARIRRAEFEEARAERRAEEDFRNRQLQELEDIRNQLQILNNRRR